MNPEQHADVRSAVERRMASFEHAERSLDGPALIEHFSDAGDFYMHNDGLRLTREDVVAGVTQAYPTLRSLEGGFGGLQIHVLAADAALATALFEETITTRDGAIISQRGAATWLWRQRGGRWQIAYGHVDHFPNTR